MKFEDSELYKTGEAYYELGILLTNPDATFEDIVRFNRTNEAGLKVDIRIFAKDKEEEQNEA